jgi:hypothetical protein
MDRAEEEHPELFEKAAQALYDALRLPPLALVVVFMEEDERQKLIRDGIHDIYKQMVAAEKDSANHES